MFDSGVLVQTRARTKGKKNMKMPKSKLLKRALRRKLNWSRSHAVPRLHRMRRKIRTMRMKLKPMLTLIK